VGPPAFQSSFKRGDILTHTLAAPFVCEFTVRVNHGDAGFLFVGQSCIGSFGLDINWALNKPTSDNFDTTLPALDPSPVIPSDLSFGYLSAELKSPVKIPILDCPSGSTSQARPGLSGRFGRG
jgi:hypothetical protein